MQRVQSRFGKSQNGIVLTLPWGLKVGSTLPALYLPSPHIRMTGLICESLYDGNNKNIYSLLVPAEVCQYYEALTKKQLKDNII